MAQKHLAFLVMGPHYNPEEHKAIFVTTKRNTILCGVRDFDEACEMVKDLVQNKDVGAIELCGAFGPEKCKKLIELTDNQIPIGYVTHFSEQDDLFDAFFGK